MLAALLPFVARCATTEEAHDVPAEGGYVACNGQCDLLQHTACTCSSADPCGWVGDGTCDDACYAMFPDNHLTDAIDCGEDSGAVPPPNDAGDTKSPPPDASLTDVAQPDGPVEVDSGHDATTEPTNPLEGTCPLTLPGATGSEPAGLIPVCCVPAAADRDAIEEVFYLLNQHRQNNGRAPLTYDSVLESAIQGHCEHMSEHDFFDHYAPESLVYSPWDRAAKCGGDAGGENIAWGYTNAQEVMQGWKESPGHNENMLDPNFTRVGIGRLGDYWGQLFGF